MSEVLSRIAYRKAVALALAEELERDINVFLLGEDVGKPGGVFKATDGLFEQFGESRIFDTPIAEQAIIGCAIGAAATGLRPVAEIMFADFAGVCYDQIANQLAKFRYQTGGQVAMPVTIRFANGGSIGFGAQHSQNVENWFLNHAGLIICAPSTPADLYGILKSAIRNDNPVLVFEHKALYESRGDIEVGKLVPIGVASVVRTGADITVVASQLMRNRCEEASEILAAEGIDVELIDPRTILPMDTETIFKSIKKTGRLICVQESSEPGSWGASLVATSATNLFEYFKSPPRTLSSELTPVPFAKSLEEQWMPSVDRIVNEIREMFPK